MMLGSVCLNCAIMNHKFFKYMTHYPPKAQQSCSICYYAYERFVPYTQTYILECRAEPPKQAEALWPEVNDDDWCGTWANANIDR